MYSSLSYVSRPMTTPLMYKTIIDTIREDVEKHPDKECLICRRVDGHRESLSYKELEQKATSLAKVLVSKGVAKGNRIALLGPNSLERAVAEFAIILSGGVVVQLPMNLTDSDILQIFNMTECRFVLIDPGRDDSNIELMCRLVDTFSSDESTYRLKDPPLVFMRSTFSMTQIQKHVHILEESTTNISSALPKLFPEDQILIFTTSGSTGKPKMVPHSHFDVVNICHLRDETYGIFFNDCSFNWIGGNPCMFIAFHAPQVFIELSTTSTCQNTLDKWKIIKEEKCTDAILLPYFLYDLIQASDEYKDPFKLEVIVAGEQTFDKQFIQRISAFTKSLLNEYGSTEALRLTRHSIFSAEDKLLAGDVGTPDEGVEIKVVDEHGTVTDRCVPGEICIRCPTMFNGYYKDEVLTKESFLDGHWFRSGDIGYITKDGHIIIQGRIKDVIYKGTRKIMPMVLEDVIMEMSGLANVIVVPVPDKRLREEICVCFITEKDYEIKAENVRLFCEQKFVVESATDGHLQMPKYYLKFESFPKLHTGKFDKKEICNQATARLMINRHD